MDCPVCRRTFPARSRQIYCCAACRIEAGRQRGRATMREKRSSFSPHPCLDCEVILIGRSLRCPPCKIAEIKRVQRESKRLAQAARAIEINARRRDRRKENPDRIREADRRQSAVKIEKIKSDPARLEKARARYRKYANKKRAEKEAAALENLTINPNHGPT